MARRFASGNTLTCAVGNANLTRAGTVILLIRAYDAAFDALTANTDFVTGRNGTTATWDLFLDAGNLFADNDFGSGLAGPTDKNTWYAIAYTKVSGSQAYHYHIAAVGGAWTHGTSGTSVDGAGGTTNVLFGQGPIKGAALFDIAAAATFSSALSDAAVEALGTTAMDTWLAASPTAAWEFDQASTSDPVTDLTGGGADQTAISGTTVVSDPVGWSYSTGGSTATAVGRRARILRPGAGPSNLARFWRTRRTVAAPFSAVDAAAECATATSAASDATTGVAPAVEAATATGVANDATVSTTSGTNATAECAAAVGAAGDPTLTVAPVVEAATATGTANDPTITVAPAVQAATATAAANDATVQTGSFTNAVAECATATAAAGDIAASVAASAVLAAAAAIVDAAAVAIATQAGAAAGIGVVDNPSVGVGSSAGVAAGSGAGNDATVTVSIGAEAAAAVGVAFDASVSVAGPGIALAGVATAAAVAFQPLVTKRIIRPNTGTVPRPATGTITRPSTGTTTRPATGTITRPNTGTIPRP